MILRAGLRTQEKLPPPTQQHFEVKKIIPKYAIQDISCILRLGNN